MSKKICQLPSCGCEFEDKTSNGNAKYCSPQHQWDASRMRKKQKRLNGPPEPSPEHVREQAPEQKQISLVTPKLQSTTVQLDPIGAFIKSQLEEKVNDLKDQVKKKDALIEKLQEDLKAKEKEADELQKNLEAKPTGLMGFAERNQSMLEKIGEGLGPKFGEGLGDVFQAIAKKMNPPSPHAIELDKWMQTLGEQQRNEVLLMLQGMINLGPQKMMEKINEVTRALMEVNNEQAHALPQKKQVGIGL